MKKRFLLILFIIVICAISVYAAPSGKAGPSSIYVSFDPAKMKLETIQIDFTSNQLSAPVVQDGQVISNFNDYSSIVSLNGNIVLTHHVTDSDFYADANNFFISWKIYYHGTVDLILAIDGPMSATVPSSTTDTINWKIYNPNETSKQSGTDLANPGSDYVPGQFIAYTSKLGNPGVSGSCPLAIKTQPLWDKKFVSYTGYATATVHVH